MLYARPRLIEPLRVSLRRGELCRTLVNTPQRPATVTDHKAASSSTSSTCSLSSTEPTKPLSQSIYGSKELLDAKKEKKFAQYERILAEKAKR